MIRKIFTSFLSIILYILIILTTILFVINKKINFNDITGKVLANYIKDIDYKKLNTISEELFFKYLMTDEVKEKDLTHAFEDLSLNTGKMNDALKNTKNFLSENKTLRYTLNISVNYLHKAGLLKILYILIGIILALIIGISKTIYKGIKNVGKTVSLSGTLIFILAYLGIKFIKIDILKNLFQESLYYLKTISYYEIGIGIGIYILGFILKFVFSKNNK